MLARYREQSLLLTNFSNKTIVHVLHQKKTCHVSEYTQRALGKLLNV